MTKHENWLTITLPEHSSLRENMELMVEAYSQRQEKPLNIVATSMRYRKFFFLNSETLPDGVVVKSIHGFQFKMVENNMIQYRPITSLMGELPCTTLFQNWAHSNPQLDMLSPHFKLSALRFYLFYRDKKQKRKDKQYEINKLVRLLSAKEFSNFKLKLLTQKKDGTYVSEVVKFMEFHKNTKYCKVQKKVRDEWVEFCVQTKNLKLLGSL